MKFTRRVARLERQVKQNMVKDAPICIAYIPSNGRGDVPPGRTEFRSGPGVVAVYDPNWPPKESSDTRPGEKAPPS